LAETAQRIEIYCDTSVLPSNIRHNDEKSLREKAAMDELRAGVSLGRYVLRVSGVNDREVSDTQKMEQRAALTSEYKALSRIERDEKLLGINTVFDQRGGFVGNSPILSEIQDDGMRDDLVAMGLSQRDAEHLTQAICNNCEYFLTRDENSMIRPHKQKVEERFPSLKIRLPSELVGEFRASGILIDSSAAPPRE
jgi:hypothetical protein